MYQIMVEGLKDCEALFMTSSFVAIDCYIGYEVSLGHKFSELETSDLC